MEIADYIIADDRALVELVLQGDNIAFEYLFERYKEACLLYTSDAADD